MQLMRVVDNIVVEIVTVPDFVTVIVSDTDGTLQYTERPSKADDFFHAAMGFEVAPDGVVIGSVRDGKKFLRPPEPPPPLVPPRELTRRGFKEAALGLGALDALKGAVAKAKAKDQIYWEDEDTFVESNPKLGRLAAAAKVDVVAVFDAVAA